MTVAGVGAWAEPEPGLQVPAHGQRRLPRRVLVVSTLGRGVVWSGDWRRRRQLQAEGGVVSAEGCWCSPDEAACALRRRVVLSKGLRALVAGAAERRSRRLLWFPRGGTEAGAAVGCVGVRAVHKALSAWWKHTITRRRARGAGKLEEDALRRRRLVEGLRDWQEWTWARARSRRAGRVRVLRGWFVALRQVWCGVNGVSKRLWLIRVWCLQSTVVVNLGFGYNREV